MSREDESGDLITISEEKLRQIFREELRRALGVDQTDVEKLMSLSLAERKAYAKAQWQEQKRRAKEKTGKR